MNIRLTHSEVSKDIIKNIKKPKYNFVSSTMYYNKYSTAYIIYLRYFI